MKRLIYRVDDRFIHGQVLEGWVNYLKIVNIIIVNDLIADDSMRASIYGSTLPANTNYKVYSIKDFCKGKPYLKTKKKYTLVIVGSIDDLIKLKETFNESIYFNIGCISTGIRDVCVNDSVFLSLSDFKKLQDLSDEYNIYFHKVPWEKPVIFSNHKRV